MNKIYSRINWKNYPSEETALNEKNLNKMDLALYNIDNRVVEMDATKVNKEVANSLVKSWSMDESTGIITITHLDGSKDMFDLNVEKIPVNFELSNDGILTMTTDDGSKFTANIGAMIPVLTFDDSDEIAVSISGEGVNKTYSFSIKSGSVTEDKLQPNFLADVKTEVAKAKASEQSSYQSAYAAKASELASKESEKNAKESEDTAKSYAVGDTGTRVGEETDNARYYKEQTDVSLGASEQIKRDVSQMKSDVYNIKLQVERDKDDIDKTIKDSLLSSSEDILNSVKDYFDRANQLYNSIYIDCDGETPQQRAATIVNVNCGTPQSRRNDNNGILFDGGTPINRLLAS